MDQICLIDDCDDLADDGELCQYHAEKRWRKKKLTRQERLQGLADQGIDTWDEYRDYMGEE